MAVVKDILIIPLDGTGTEIPSLYISDTYEEYWITGSVTSTGNYAINPTGTPIDGTTFVFKWKANLDLNTNSNTLSIFGQSITEAQATKKFTAIATYNGSGWEVELEVSFGESGIIETNMLAVGAIDAASLGANSVASSNIIDGTIQAVDIANATITQAKLAANSVGTSQLIAANVTTAKIANLAITTGLVNDDAITNAKLNTMTFSSLKYGNATGDPGDLALGNNEIAIGNGTTVTTMSIDDIAGTGIGQEYSIVIPVSFEASEKAWNTIYITTDLLIKTVLVSITKAIAGTDDGLIHINDDINATTVIDITIPMSTVINTEILNTGINYPFAGSGASKKLSLVTTKTTSGGKALVTIIGERS